MPAPRAIHYEPLVAVPYTRKPREGVAPGVTYIGLFIDPPDAEAEAIKPLIEVYHQ